MKYVICGNYGVGNLGDECILEGVKKLIQAKDKNASFEVMGKGKLFPVGIRTFIQSIFKRSLWCEPRRLIKSADAVIIGGGGLFTDEERPLTGFFWALQGLLAHWNGKKVVILGVSFGPMDMLSRFFVKKLLKRAASVYCRDEYSVTLVYKMGRKSELCPDMAWYAFDDRQIQSIKHKSGEKSVLLILRSFKNMTHNKITFFAQLIQRLHKNFAFKTTLMPFDYVSKNDDILMNKISDQILDKSIFCVQKAPQDIHDIPTIFSEYDLVFSMRLHGVLLSLLLNKPIISINYMKKSSILCQFDDLKSCDLENVDTQLFGLFVKCFESTHYSSSIAAAHERIIGFKQTFFERFRV